MAFIEVLDADFSRSVQEREWGWARRFASGLQISYTEYEHFLLDAVLDQMSSKAYWSSLVSERRQMEKEEREVMRSSCQPYIPGIPDEIVQNHIWPRVQKSFTGISDCQQAQKEAILSTLFSLRLLNKRWKHLLDFSYEWAVYRMVRRDFNEGWVWYSYYPTLMGPYTELSRMMDLLPDPSAREVSPKLHKAMGVLPTDALWIWRSFLNMNKKLRYDNAHVHCGLPGDETDVVSPCYDCIFYPRGRDPLVVREPDGARGEAICNNFDL